MRSAATVVALAALTAATALGGSVLYDSGGFEGYALGSLPGQDGWVEDTTDPSYGTVDVIADPTGAGMGQVIVLDPPGTAGGWLGAFRAFGPSTAPIVIIEWDQWRADTNDNFWYADSVAFDGWWAMQWDQNGQASAYFFDFGVDVTPGIWQHVTYTIDTLNGTATVDIDGTSFTTNQPDLSIDGIDLEVEPTEAGGAGGPVYLDNLLVTQVPEPAALALLAVGLVALRRR